MNTKQTITHDLVAERTGVAVRTIRGNLKPCLVCPSDPVIKKYLGDAAGNPEAAQRLTDVINHIVSDEILSCPIRTSIKVCIDEQDQLRRDNAAIRAKANADAFALEFLKGNVPNADKLLAQAHEEYTRRAMAPNGHDLN